MAQKRMRHHLISLKVKAEAVERVINGQSQKESAKQACVSQFTMSNWMKKYFGPIGIEKGILNMKSKV